MTGAAYATSAEMAAELGAFPGYAPNGDHMLRVIRNHRRAAQGHLTDYEGLSVQPVALDHANCPDSALVNSPTRSWDEALEMGEKHGFRNAQVTVIAPTGTIGLVMDCDTTGIEPDFALVKFKKLAGGGYFKIINRSVPPALVEPRLQARPGRGDHRLARSATARSEGARASTPPPSSATASARPRSTSSRRRCPRPSTSASSSTSGRWARSSARRPRHPPGEAARPGLRPPAALGFTRARSTPPTPTSAAR